MIERKCINPKCNRKVIDNLFCSSCVINLSIFTRLRIYGKKLEGEGKL